MHPIALTAVLLATIASLIGLLLAKKQLSKKHTHLLVALWAGIMTSISLTHILPETAEQDELAGIFFFLWFCVVFLLDYFQCTHPHEGHDEEHEHHDHAHAHTKKSPWSFGWLYLHTLFDGVAIAGAFSISAPVGIMTTAGVILHQIPVSLSLAAIAQHARFSFKTTLSAFILFAGSVLAGAILFASLWIEEAPSSILSFAGGTLLYVGASDLLPELKHQSQGKLGLIWFFFGGILPILSHLFVH